MLFPSGTVTVALARVQEALAAACTGTCQHLGCRPVAVRRFRGFGLSNLQFLAALVGIQQQVEASCEGRRRHPRRQLLRFHSPCHTKVFGGWRAPITVINTGEQTESAGPSSWSCASPEFLLMESGGECMNRCSCADSLVGCGFDDEHLTHASAGSELFMSWTGCAVSVARLREGRGWGMRVARQIAKPHGSHGNSQPFGITRTVRGLQLEIAVRKISWHQH